MFNDMIANMEFNKKLSPIVVELSIFNSQYVSCFYITILFQSAIISLTKLLTKENFNK